MKSGKFSVQGLWKRNAEGSDFIRPNEIIYIAVHVRKILVLYSLFKIYKCEFSASKNTRKGQV